MALQKISGHKVKRNHCNAVPRYIIAIDTETLPEQSDVNGRQFCHRLRLAVAITGRYQDGKIVGKKYHRLKTKAEIWELVKSFSAKNYVTWVVFHNALFDTVISGMPEEFENAELQIDRPRSIRQQFDPGVERTGGGGIACIESPPFILGCRVSRSQGRIVIVDTLNWFNCPLRDLGRNCGLEKLPMPEFTADDETWFDYCKRDTEITFDSFVGLIRWVKDKDMGMFRYTGASQAMSAFRHKYMDHEIMAHDNLPAKVIERSGYFGGRFECWKIGAINETVHQYDVNGLFPSVMQFGLFPSAIGSIDCNTNYSDCILGSINGNAIAEVEIEIKEANYPQRCERGVCYPLGRFKTTLVGPELLSAIKRGYVKRVRSILRYQMAPLFTKFVTELFQMRQEYKAAENPLYERFVKTIMNSLYGKFGQRAPEWENIPGRMDALPWMTWTDFDAASGEKSVYRSLGWQVQRQNERDVRHHADMEVNDWESHAIAHGGGEMPSSFIAISAFVTAHARMRMNYLRSVAGNENVFYQGVDSLIVTETGKQKLQLAGEVSDTELGKMRLQMSANYGYINGCSDYSVGDKLVLSGLRCTQNQLTNATRIQRSFAAKPYLFKGIACDYVMELLSDWKRTSKYWKGIVTTDGQVTPLVMPLEGNCSLEPS